MIADRVKLTEIVQQKIIYDSKTLGFIETVSSTVAAEGAGE